MRERLMACGATALGILVLAPGWALAAPDGRAPASNRPPVVQRAGSNPVTEDSDRDGVPNCPDPVGDRDNRHPSGRDRHCESGTSGVQGRSASDPDGASNGGVDKPGGAGGVDVYDQDGNNGCGNDEDFEDDNRGRCLGRAKATEAPRPIGQTAQVRAAQWRRQWERANPMPVAAVPQQAPSRLPAGVRTSSGAEVLGVAFARGAGQTQSPTSSAGQTVPTSSTGQAGSPTSPLVVSVPEVAAGSDVRTPAGALPFTGLPIVPLTALAAVLIGVGAAARRASRLRAVGREP